MSAVPRYSIRRLLTLPEFKDKFKFHEVAKCYEFLDRYGVALDKEPLSLAAYLPDEYVLDKMYKQIRLSMYHDSSLFQQRFTLPEICKLARHLLSSDIRYLDLYFIGNSQHYLIHTNNRVQYLYPLSIQKPEKSNRRGVLFVEDYFVDYDKSMVLDDISPVQKIMYEGRVYAEIGPKACYTKIKGRKGPK